MIKCFPLSGLLSTESALGNSKNKSSSARIDFVIKQQHSKSATAARDILRESSVVLSSAAAVSLTISSQFPMLYLSCLRAFSLETNLMTCKVLVSTKRTNIKETYSKMLVMKQRFVQRLETNWPANHRLGTVTFQVTNVRTVRAA